jgi:hypothetical protein
MRTLIVSAAALLITAVPSAALASSPTDGVSLQAMSVTAPTIGLQTTTRSKKKKETASFESIGDATHGKKVAFHVKVAKPDRTCDLKVRWADGTSSSDSDTAGSDKICSFTEDAPKGAAGDAKATATIRDGSGNKVTTVTKTFSVK